jgi:hypothetical protein
MKTGDFVISSTLILILVAIFYILIKNYTVLLILNNGTDDSLLELITAENFFSYIFMIFSVIGLYCILSQLKKYNLRKNVITLICLFFLSISTFFAIIKVSYQNMSVFSYVENYLEFISALTIILILSVISFLGIVSRFFNQDEISQS